MPVPAELRPFFTSLVDKSRRCEINWEATGRADSFRVRFSDFSIVVAQEGDKPFVHVQLLNDRGDVTAAIRVDDKDEEWIGAVGLINSAARKVKKIGHTMRRAMEELGKDGLVGLEPSG